MEQQTFDLLLLTMSALAVVVLQPFIMYVPAMVYSKLPNGEFR